MSSRILIGDVRERLAELPAGSVHCCITSPPYWGLRDYGVEGQLGLEASPDQYVAAMVDVFREVRRVLHPTGTMFLNIGDTYATSGGRGDGPHPFRPGRAYQQVNPLPEKRAGIAPKNVCGVPWRLGFALQDDGWILRQELIWQKPSPMPTSAKDRFCCAHEQMFLLTKSPKYFFDWLAASEPAVSGRGSGNGFKRQQRLVAANGDGSPRGNDEQWCASRRMRRSVWKIAPRGFKGAHFAVFPPALVEPCILAGTPLIGVCEECGTPWERIVHKERRPTRPGTNSKVNRASDDPDSPYEQHSGSVVGNRDPQRHVTEYVTTGWQKRCRCACYRVKPATVLDPFLGSGTTLMVAKELGRDGIGVELNADYAEMARGRIDGAQPRMVELMEVG